MGALLRSVSLLIIEASLCLFFILYGGPSDHFFAYYIGALRSLSSLTKWGPSDQFLLIQYGGPSQISFIVYYMPPPPPLRSVSLHDIGGPSQILVFSQNIWGPSSDQFLRLLYGAPSCYFFLLLYGAPSDQFLRTLYGGGGGPQISFFAYYMGVP